MPRGKANLTIDPDLKLTYAAPTPLSDSGAYSLPLLCVFYVQPCQELVDDLQIKDLSLRASGHVDQCGTNHQTPHRRFLESSVQF